MVDQTHEIAQSIAIISYIEKLADLNPPNPIIAAKTDAICGEDFLTKRDEMTPYLLSRFDDLDRALSSRGKNFGRF